MIILDAILVLLYGAVFVTGLAVLNSAKERWDYDVWENIEAAVSKLKYSLKFQKKRKRVDVRCITYIGICFSTLSGFLSAIMVFNDVLQSLLGFASFSLVTFLAHVSAVIGLLALHLTVALFLGKEKNDY